MWCVRAVQDAPARIQRVGHGGVVAVGRGSGFSANPHALRSAAHRQPPPLTPVDGTPAQAAGKPAAAHGCGALRRGSHPPACACAAAVAAWCTCRPWPRSGVPWSEKRTLFWLPARTITSPEADSSPCKQRHAETCRVPAWLFDAATIIAARQAVRSGAAHACTHAELPRRQVKVPMPPRNDGAHSCSHVEQAAGMWSSNSGSSRLRPASHHHVRQGAQAGCPPPHPLRANVCIGGQGRAAWCLLGGHRCTQLFSAIARGSFGQLHLPRHQPTCRDCMDAEGATWWSCERAIRLGVDCIDMLLFRPPTATPSGPLAKRVVVWWWWCAWWWGW